MGKEWEREATHTEISYENFPCYITIKKEVYDTVFYVNENKIVL